MRTALMCALLLLPQAALAHPRYYVVVSGVTESPGVSSGIAAEAKALFLDELKRHPEITLEAPAGLPSEPDAMVKELKRRKIKAYELTLKILEVDRAINPPPAGKQYRVLVRGIKLSVIGDTIPLKTLAIGGDGEAQIGQEVGNESNLDREGKSLLLDCTKDAIKQAVDMTVSKLDLIGKPVRLRRHRKKS